MTPRLDRYGDPIEDDDGGHLDRVPMAMSKPGTSTGGRNTVRERCDELRRIIRAARANRQAGQ